MVNGVWQKTTDRMRESLGQVGYETWITPLHFIDLQHSDNRGAQPILPRLG